jgi:hypothetical protein
VRRERVRRRVLRVGAAGTIRKIEPAEPSDGDETFIWFTIRFRGVGETYTEGFASSEIAPAAQLQDYLWLRRQLAGLSRNGG